MNSGRGARGDVAALVPAAGAGLRLGSGTPKALRLLGGEPLLVHAVRRLASATSVTRLVVAAPPGHEDTVRELLAGTPAVVVSGGTHRQQSVAAALSAVPAECDVVLVHDAARALIPVSLVEDVIAAVRSGHDAVIPVLPVTDTVVEVDPAGDLVAAVDRSVLRAVQTPQGFRRTVLADAHDRASGAPATDDAGLVARLGLPVRAIPGSDLAMKITTPHDLVLADYLHAHAG